MDLHLIIDNLTNPALLFFFLGIFAVQFKSDLAIPESSSKFISFYLLLSIGFKGGQELSHSEFNMEIVWSLLFGVLLAVVIPVFVDRYDHNLPRRKPQRPLATIMLTENCKHTLHTSEHRPVDHDRTGKLIPFLLWTSVVLQFEPNG